MRNKEGWNVPMPGCPSGRIEKTFTRRSAKRSREDAIAYYESLRAGAVAVRRPIVNMTMTSDRNRVHLTLEWRELPAFVEWRELPAFVDVA